MIEILKKSKVTEVVGIRGLFRQIEDLEFEEDSVETLMWNPLHFAVYYQNFELVRFLVKDLKVNFAMTGPKANAESEKDEFNNEHYPEDKILLLLLAYDRRNSRILKFLLDQMHMFWPTSTVKQLLEDRFNSEVSQIQAAGQQRDHWVKVVGLVLRSKTAWVFWGSMSSKKRTTWMENFLGDMESHIFSKNEDVRKAYEQEFCQQPYAGTFLFYLLFNDFSEKCSLIQQSFENCTDTDFLIYLCDSKLQPDAYFDPNKMMKYREKLTAEVYVVLEKVVQRFKVLAG